MSLFKKILRKHQINRQFKKSYKPFFAYAYKEKAIIVLIDESIPIEIVNVYNAIKTSCKKKYVKACQQYNDYVLYVKEHNNNVREIDEAVQRFNKSDILENPAKYGKDDLKHYYYIAHEIKKFKRYDEVYKIFLNDATDCYECIEIIQKEKAILDKLCEIYSKIDCMDLYIDNNVAVPIVDEVLELCNELKGFDKLFYDFSNYRFASTYIKIHNDNYIQNNLHNTLFDDINGKQLDEEQKKAVLIDEVATQVIAGAGSGKTLTICGKIEYLLKEKHISPNDILLLSYSKKSATDLEKKVSKICGDLTVSTFHKLGLDILKFCQGRKLVVEDQYKAIIEKYFREEMRKRPYMLQLVLKYYALYIGSNDEKIYKDEGELFRDLKSQNFKTIKDQLLDLSADKDNKVTLKRERVKSFEELAIANWYFINGINYEYERPYEVDYSSLQNRQYLPDFYLTDYNIYHEHYGIDENGEAKQFSAEEAKKYVDGIKWKREVHKENETVCLETYSYEFSKGLVFDKLEKELKEKGVELKPLSDEEIANTLESIYEGKAFTSLINLISTFLSLYKANYPSVDGFYELADREFESVYEKDRTQLFLEIVKEVYLFYMDYIRSENKVDFDDMIIRATNELDNIDGFRYKYIVVDEFQDISQSRMKFLRKLVLHNNAKLFVVGDDWQAIYRFSGCDINIFLKFSDYFGFSKTAEVTSTYRNSQELQNIACGFIERNPEQLCKNITSIKHLENPIQVMYYYNKKYSAFLNILKEISDKDPYANVLVLGRNNRDYESVLFEKSIYLECTKEDNKKEIKSTDYPNLKLTYSTVHASKGLEEDYVVIINANDARLGFPNKIEDDKLLDLVLSDKSTYEFAEERRLWYVALTRTRNYTYILANVISPSVFLQEIKDQCIIINKEIEEEKALTATCPKCKSGRLVLRASKETGELFYGCSNYPYCEYTIKDLESIKRNKRCKRCGDYMVLRKGDFGAFYGCNSYPECTYKEKYLGEK